jgi:hypothetical protein
LDEYGFPRVHNFNLPSIRFEDLESRLAAMPHRVPSSGPAHAPSTNANVNIVVEEPSLDNSTDAVTGGPLRSASDGVIPYDRQATMLMMQQDSSPTVSGDLNTAGNATLPATTEGQMGKQSSSLMFS